MRQILRIASILILSTPSSHAVFSVGATGAGKPSVCARGTSSSVGDLLQRASFNAENPELLSLHDLSREERVDLVCQLKSAMERKYSLFELKKSLIGLDGSVHLEACARREQEIQSNERGAFLDRLRACIAAFQDSHLDLHLRVPQPSVFTPVAGRLIGDKLLITVLTPRLVALMKERDGADLKELLKSGTEVVEIEGLKVEDAIARLLPYQSESTPLGARISASRALFSRDYAYPSKKFLRLKVRLASGAASSEIRLPWFASDETNVAWANALLERAGITPALQLKRDYDPETGAWKTGDFEREGYTSATPIFDIKKDRLQLYKGDKDQDAARMGMTVFEGKGMCYLQLLTFSDVEKLKTRDGETKPFLETIEEFITECETRKAPLVLDLRVNNGGDGNLPAPFVAMLSPKDTKTTSSFQALRLSPSTAELLGQFFSDTDGLASTTEEKTRRRLLLETATENLRQGKAYTDIIPRLDEKAKLPEGFNQKVLVLVTSDCISACDITAALVKANNRGVLIGTHTNGTGAGFWSNQDDDANFSDSYGILKLSIPNFLFGVNPKLGTDRIEFDGTLVLENRPTVADVQYQSTAEDVATKNGGWRRKILEQLK